MSIRGFTLVELLITVTIVAIMLAFAVPSYSHIIASKRMVSELNALLVDMQYARSEAQRQGTTVQICQSSDQKNCTNSNSWEQGWIVECTGAKCASTAVLKVHSAFTGPETFNASNNTSAVVYGPSGFPFPGGNAILYSMHANNDQSLTRCLQMSTVGQLIAVNSYDPVNCP
jgi:type IV fimbrial biogenesis protein FimT